MVQLLWEWDDLAAHRYYLAALPGENSSIVAEDASTSCGVHERRPMKLARCGTCKSCKSEVFEFSRSSWC